MADDITYAVVKFNQKSDAFMNKEREKGQKRDDGNQNMSGLRNKGDEATYAEVIINQKNETEPTNNPEKKETKDGKSRAGMKIPVINFFLLLVVSVIAVIALCLQFSKQASKEDDDRSLMTTNELRQNQSETVLAMMNKNISDLLLQLQQTKGNISIMTNDNRNLQSKFEKAEDTIKAISGNLTELQNQLKKEENIKELMEMKTQLTEAKKNISELQQNNNLFSKNVSSLQSQVSSSNREIALLGYNKTNMQSELQEALGKITALSKNLTVVETQLKKSTRIITAFNERFGCCPDLWVKFNSHCYYFSNDSLTWDQGKKKCVEWKSWLVIIKTDEIKEFIQNQMKSLKISKNQTPIYWIGLTDSSKEGEFAWVDGTACNCNTRSVGNWADKQPDDWLQNEDCVALAGDGKWHDRPCTYELKWICEKQADICST